MITKPTYFKDYQELCHDYALDPFSEVERLMHLSNGIRRMSTYNSKVYSYSTEIARAVKGLDGGTIILITDSNYSRTTAKHVGILRHATSHYKQITVPSHLVQYDIVNSFDCYINSMRSMIGNNELTRKERRGDFCSYYNSIREYAKEIDPSLAEQLEPFTETYNNIFRGDLKAIKERAKKELKEAQQIVKDLLVDNSTSDLAEIAFSHYNTHRYTQRVRDAMAKTLTKGGKYTYVWLNFESNLMESSQRSSIPLEVAITTMKRYLSGKSKVGDEVMHYKVFQVNEDSLRVNCHLVSRKNIEECVSEYQKHKKIVQ